MRIGRVVGNVVSTIKDESYYGYKLLIVEYWDENGQPDGSRAIVFDDGQAGVGDVVLIMADGGAANMILNDQKIIADAAIAGVVDCYTYEGQTRNFH